MQYIAQKVVKMLFIEHFWLLIHLGHFRIITNYACWQNSFMRIWSSINDFSKYFQIFHSQFRNWEWNFGHYVIDMNVVYCRHNSEKRYHKYQLLEFTKFLENEPCLEHFHKFSEIRSMKVFIMNKTSTILIYNIRCLCIRYWTVRNEKNQLIHRKRMNVASSVASKNDQFVQQYRSNRILYSSYMQ